MKKNVVTEVIGNCFDLISTGNERADRFIKRFIHVSVLFCVIALTTAALITSFDYMYGKLASNSGVVTSVIEVVEPLFETELFSDPEVISEVPDPAMPVSDVPPVE